MSKLRPGTYRVVCSIAAAIIALCSMTSNAPAQTDLCSKLDEELIKRGAAPGTDYEKEKTALDTRQATAGVKDEKERQAAWDALAREIALRDLARGGSTLRPSMDDRLAAPGSALVTFEDKRFETLNDASKICIKAFARRTGSDKWDNVGLRQVFFTDKTNDKPKRLNVIFSVDDLGGKGSKATYLFIGALTDGPPTLSFSHAAKVTLTSKMCAVIEALVFVGVFYAFLVWITYNQETAGLKGPAWVAYSLSPVRISSSWFGEASMSQVQLLLFTFIVAGLLFYHWRIEGVLSELSTNLLMLIGISAVGAGAGKFAQTVKTNLNDQTARYLIGKGWYAWESIPARSHATLSRLLLTDGRLDIYKFQMAIFTVVVACYVISVGQSSLVDVKISETMLYLIGISQGVYVGGKAITDRTTDLEAAVTKMIELENQIREAELKVAGGGVRPPELDGLYDQYAKAARTAAIEFTSLQNRMFPTKFDAATLKMTTLAPQVAPIKDKVKKGTGLTPAEQTLEQAFDAAEMTAKEYAAYSEPARKIQVQDIKNIDPAVLRP